MTGLCFEDLPVGRTLISSAVTMTEADMLDFARVFDPQPMHIDGAWATASPLGGLIASGWHTASVAMALQREAGLPATGLREIASLAWPVPVRPGDTIHVVVEIVSADLDGSRPGHGVVGFQNTASTSDGVAVLVMVGAVLVARRTDVAG